MNQQICIKCRGLVNSKGRCKCKRGWIYCGLIMLLLQLLGCLVAIIHSHNKGLLIYKLMGCGIWGITLLFCCLYCKGDSKNYVSLQELYQETHSLSETSLLYQEKHKILTSTFAE